MHLRARPLVAALALAALAAAFGAPPERGDLVPFSATLLTPDGRPYSGAARIWFGTFTSEWVTIEDGALHMGVPPGTGELAIGTEGYRATRLAGVTVDPARPFDAGELRLDRGLSIAGVVNGLDGAPLPGVAVVGTNSRTVTADDGTFELGGFEPASDSEGLVFSLDGYFSRALDHVRPGTTALKVTLERTATLSGRVVTGNPPKPLREFEVRVTTQWAPNGRSVPRDGADNAFTAADLPPAELTLSLHARGFATRWIALRLAPGERRDLGEIALEPAADVRGMVLDDRSGTPLRDATVVLDAGLGLVAPMALTGDDGRFVLGQVVPGRHEVTIAAAGHATLVRSVDVVVDGPEPLFRLGGLGAIEGLVRARNGQPCAGCTVSAKGLATGEEPAQVVSDSSGRFRFANLQPETIVVYTDDPADAETTRRRVTVLSDRAVTVELGEPSATIRAGGTVVTNDARPPAALTWEAAGVVHHAATTTHAIIGAEGTYSVALDRPGSYVVQAGSDENRGLGVVVDGTGTQRIDLDFRTRVTRGRVVDGRTGQPVSGATIVAYRTQPFLELERAMQAETGADGSFVLQLLAGVYRLRVVAPGFAASVTGDVRVDADGDQPTVKMPLQEAQPVRVRVVGEHGQPLWHANVAVLCAGFIVASVQTDPNGLAVLDGAPPGPVTVLASDGGFAPAVESGLEAVPPGVEPPSIVLTRGGALDVRVSTSDRRPAAGRLVHVLKDGLDLTPALLGLQPGLLFTGDDGAVHVARLAPGDYQVAVGLRGEVQRRKVRVQEGEPSVVDVTLGK